MTYNKNTSNRGQGFQRGKFRQASSKSYYNSNQIRTQNAYNYSESNTNQSSNICTGDDLHRFLFSLENKQWPRYKGLKNKEWHFKQFVLYFDRIQGDPHAGPSNLRIKIQSNIHQIPKHLFRNKIRNIAVCDFLTRKFADICTENDWDRRITGSWAAKKGGDLLINRPGQHVIERNSIFINDEYIEVRFDCSLPGRGRRIEGRWCAQIMCENLPTVVESALLYSSLDSVKFSQHVICIENQEYLREKILDSLDLIAFIPNGAILPRISGNSDLPMTSDVVPFQCTEDDPLRVEFVLPINDKLKFSGLGIPQGITLIVGGGFHGKSTVLQALQYGIYNHIPNDGREYCCCLANAIKIRAEDGRSIANVNISPFINNLPQKKNTEYFSTQCASGSTSQAASICESLEIGTNLLLIDEDTCATNFMIRDRSMQLLVSVSKEPITPFIARIRSMFNDFNVSSVIVVGGSGSYFQVADHVIMMDNYLPVNVTEKAKDIHASLGTKEVFEFEHFGQICDRYPIAGSIAHISGNEIRIKITDKYNIRFGNENIDLLCIPQIVEYGQTIAISRALVYIQNMILEDGSMDDQLSVSDVVGILESELNRDYLYEKMDVLQKVKANVRYANRKNSKMVRPRIQEIFAALNRLRSVRFQAVDYSVKRS